jgi:hypothetical protein
MKRRGRELERQKDIEESKGKVDIEKGDENRTGTAEEEIEEH